MRQGKATGKDNQRMADESLLDIENPKYEPLSYKDFFLEKVKKRKKILVINLSKLSLVVGCCF